MRMWIFNFIELAGLLPKLLINFLQVMEEDGVILDIPLKQLDSWQIVTSFLEVLAFLEAVENTQGKLRCLLIRFL